MSSSTNTSARTSKTPYCETIGGLVTDRFEHVPRADEVLEEKNFRIRILRADERQVQTLLVERIDECAARRPEARRRRRAALSGGARFAASFGGVLPAPVRAPRAASLDRALFSTSRLKPLSALHSSGRSDSVGSRRDSPGRRRA